MSIDHINNHKEQVKLWEERNAPDLRDEQIIKIFENAILTVERRCLVTLSNITVQVVLDRVLHEGHLKYPPLSFITVELEGLNFSGLNHHSENYKIEEMKDALRYLLIEFLTVIGNITSDVLTLPLHKELMEVTPESALKIQEVQNLRPMNTIKKRGER